MKSYTTTIHEGGSIKRDFKYHVPGNKLQKTKTDSIMIREDGDAFSPVITIRSGKLF